MVNILKSEKVVQVNILIMQAFVFIRQYTLNHKDLTEKLKELESKKQKNRKKIGFKGQNEREQ